jgi:hypothetical protein
MFLMLEYDLKLLYLMKILQNGSNTWENKNKKEIKETDKQNKTKQNSKCKSRIYTSNSKSLADSK